MQTSAPSKCQGLQGNWHYLTRRVPTTSMVQHRIVGLTRLGVRTAPEDPSLTRAICRTSCAVVCKVVLCHDKLCVLIWFSTKCDVGMQAVAAASAPL